MKTTFYWHTGQAGIGCYAANATFASHPEWWLRDDGGHIVGHKDSTHPAGQPRIDWTNEEAAAWWVSVPLAGEGAGELIDGVLADGAGYEAIPDISEERLQQLYDAKLRMLARLQAAFDKIGRGGVVFGNGLSEYDQDPSDPHSRRILNVTRGIQNEHFAAFEQVDPATGNLRKDKVSDVLDQIEWASTVNGSTKQVFCSFWAGPYTTPSFEHTGWPAYANGVQPCGVNCTASQQYAGWRSALVKYLPFNLAAFLTVAGPNTWFTQAVWYEDHQGFFPCPEAPNTCAMPDDFYAGYLKRPLGAPKGRRQKEGAYKWTREFEKATVTLDLNQPLAGSSINFHGGRSQ